MPDRGKRIADIALVDFSYGGLSQLRQNVQFQWGKLATRLAVAFQFGLAAFECVQRNIGQPVHVARGPKAFRFTLSDRTATVAAPVFCRFARFLQSDIGIATKSHFMPPTVKRVTTDPLRTATFALVEPKPATIGVFSKTGFLRVIIRYVIQAVFRLNPLSDPPSIYGVQWSILKHLNTHVSGVYPIFQSDAVLHGTPIYRVWTPITGTISSHKMDFAPVHGHERCLALVRFFVALQGIVETPST